MHLSSASPRGGGPRADVGEYGDFMGTLQQIYALVVGEMWGLRFLNALLSGRMWGLRFCSTERRLGTIDGKMTEEKFRIVVYSHLSPSRLLLSMGTNSLVLKITLKYHGGNHKNRTNGCPSSKREPQTENPILTKTEIRNEETQKRSLLSD